LGTVVKNFDSGGVLRVENSAMLLLLNMCMLTLVLMCVPVLVNGYTVQTLYYRAKISFFALRGDCAHEKYLFILGVRD